MFKFVTFSTLRKLPQNKRHTARGTRWGLICRFQSKKWASQKTLGFQEAEVKGFGWTGSGEVAGLAVATAASSEDVSNLAEGGFASILVAEVFDGLVKWWVCIEVRALYGGDNSWLELVNRVLLCECRKLLFRFCYCLQGLWSLGHYFANCRIKFDCGYNLKLVFQLEFCVFLRMSGDDQQQRGDGRSVWIGILSAHVMWI